MNLISKLLTLAAAVSLCGCATVMRYQFDEGPNASLCPTLPYLYGGTVIDWHLLSGNDQGSTFEGSSGPVRVLGLLDMPLSAVADTVLLPVSIPLQIRQNRRQSQRADAGELGCAETPRPAEINSAPLSGVANSELVQKDAGR